MKTLTWIAVAALAVLSSAGPQAQTADLYAIAGNASSAVAAGTGGKVISSTGGNREAFTDAQLTPSISDDLHGAAENGDGTYFLVGDAGVVLKSTGLYAEAFIAESSPTSADLRAVAPFLTRMAAVGASGAIVRSNSLLGGGWTAVTSPTTATLRGLAHNALTGVAVGDDGVLLVGDPYGGNWSVVGGDPAQGASLRDAASLTDDRFIVVGAAGTVLRGLANGSGWTLLEGPGAVDLNGVAVRPGASQLVVAVGGGGAIYTSTDAGESWTAVDSGVARDLWAVTYTGIDFLATGDHGTLLRSLDGTLWSDKTPTVRTSWGRLRDQFR